VRSETRGTGDEYSFFQVFKKLPAGLGQSESWKLPKPAKTAAVFRPGAYGDALFASSVLWHLKREGYHVTLYTEEPGEEVLRHDPNIDRIVVIGRGQIPEGFLTQYFEGIAHKYDRAINLVESSRRTCSPGRPTAASSGRTPCGARSSAATTSSGSTTSPACRTSSTSASTPRAELAGAQGLARGALRRAADGGDRGLRLDAAEVLAAPAASSSSSSPTPACTSSCSATCAR
jgi:hypothetical protein